MGFSQGNQPRSGQRRSQRRTFVGPSQRISDQAELALDGIDEISSRSEGDLPADGDTSALQYTLWEDDSLLFHNQVTTVRR
jgi:hypothetical protein